MVYNTARGIFGKAVRYERRCRGDEAVSRERWSGLGGADHRIGVSGAYQIVGYIISGDPTYITSYNNARSLIKRLERDELLEELVRFYVENHDC